jgi:hypothetical protein
MAQTKIRRTRELRYDSEKIVEMCAGLVRLVDDVMHSDPWTRRGSDARRLLRVAVKQMQWRADATGDALLAAVVYDALEKLKENSPELFA